MRNSSIKCTEIEGRYCFSIVLMINFCQFFNNWKRILNYPKLFEIRIKLTFAMNTFHVKASF